MLEGLEVSALERVFRDVVRLTSGARAMVRTMRAHGAHTVLVSGGFTYFTNRVRTLAGFDADQGNRLEVDNGRLTGRVGEPIINRDGKQRALEKLASERGMALADTMAVGDGANDIGMLRVAGLGVAFRAETAVAQRAAARVDHGDLSALLYLQGYRESDISRDAR
jgi:phosphoserine phosphatase